MFKNVEYEIIQKVNDIEINNLEYDSRKITKNDCFIAMKGTNMDGNNYINDAIKNGAICVITDNKNIDIKEYKNTNFYYVKNLRENLGVISSNFYDYPQDKLCIIGITGTNGKTTSSFILENILKNSSRVGTNNYRILDTIYEAKNTTPESLDLIKLMKESVEKNVKYFIMEVSSHALAIGRVNMLKFDGAIFTNLTQDHLDFHKTMQEYFNSKCKIIKLLKENAKICLNIDDEYINKIDIPNKLTFSINDRADIEGKVLNYFNSGMELSLKISQKEYTLHTKLIGKHNLYNIMGCVSLCLSLGIDINLILDRISSMDCVDGRFELINNRLNAKIVVDYAHTPDGLENVLKTLKEITGGKLYCLFGAGGDRDRTKRPIMGNIASKYADFCILTSDNPRTENPIDILKDIEKGMNTDQYKIIESRKEAIEYAISILKENDSLLVAGKGHENYQIIGNVKLHFSDKEQINNTLKKIRRGG